MASFPHRTVEEACIIEYGTRVVRRLHAGSIHPVYGGGGETFFVDDFNREDRTIISRFGMSPECVRHVQGRFFLNDSGLTIAPRDHKLFGQRYLNYWAFWMASRIFELGRGSAQRNLDIDGFRRLPIPAMAMPIQDDITAFLDEAFAGIAKLTANVERNISHCNELYATISANEFAGRSHWSERSLKEVCEKITDGTHQTPKYFDSGYIFLSSRNVTSRRIDWDNVKFIDHIQHLEMQRRVSPRLGDVLLAKNGTTGVAAIVDRDVKFDIYVSLAHLRPLSMLRSRFLLHFVNSPIAKRQFNSRLKGAGVPNLHLEEIREVRIRFPETLEEQDKVVEQIERLQTAVDKITNAQRSKLATIADLKKSLLQKSFAGQLTDASAITA